MTTAHNVCFISAPFGTNINMLKKVLNSRNISVLDDSAVDFLEPLDVGILRLMKKADFFIGIVPNECISDVVFFEMGIACGAKKPALLLRERDIQLPMEWSELVSVNLPLDDEISLSAFIDSYLGLENSRIRERKPRKSKTNREIDVNWMADTLGESKDGKEVHLEDAIRRLFIETGYRVGPMESQKGGVRADLVVWMDTLEEYFQNPIFIETKQGELTPHFIHQAEDRLRMVLCNRKAALGLLILNGPIRIPPEEQSAKLPLVLKFSLTELVELLSTSRLESTIVNYRNKIAHGGVGFAPNSKR